jgi:hypothetical protein
VMVARHRAAVVAGVAALVETLATRRDEEP